MNNKELEFYVDTLIVEALLSNNDLSKTAQSSMVQDLISKVKHYFDNHIDPDDKSGSILNLLAPGALSMAFSAMGLGWLGVLIGLAMRVFNIDVAGVLSSIYNELKSYISQDQKLTSSQVQSMVDSAVQQHTGEMSEADAERAMSHAVTSFDQTMRDVKLLKLAMIAYDAEINGLTKEAKFNWSLFSSKRAKSASILSRVLGFIFKIALASAGFMVAGDVVNKFLGRPNALDDTIQKGKPVAAPAQEAAPLSRQTKFAVKSSYVDTKYNYSSNWIEKIPNNQSSIEDMVLRFAKEVYDGLDSLDAQIRSSMGFNKIVNDIAWYNHASAGDQLVFIPKNFTSKKDLVDHFIDEVAAKAS